MSRCSLQPKTTLNQRRNSDDITLRDGGPFKKSKRDETLYRPTLTKATSFIQKHPQDAEDVKLLSDGKSFKRAKTIQCLEEIKYLHSTSYDRIPDLDHSASSDDVLALGVRAWIQNWSFFLSLPRLMMLSHLQNIIGVRGTRTPSILPNDYMDNLLTNVKLTMKERGLSQVDLPDQEVGVILHDGHLSGLTNLHRHGDAKLEAETDHFLFTFAIAAKNIKAGYDWKKQRLKGKVSASISQVTLKMQIKQAIPNNTPPELVDFQVDEINGIIVSMDGLGPLNWMVRRLLRSLLRRHLKQFLEREGRSVIEQELRNVTINDLMDASFPIFPPLSFGL